MAKINYVTPGHLKIGYESNWSVFERGSPNDFC